MDLFPIKLFRDPSLETLQFCLFSQLFPCKGMEKMDETKRLFPAMLIGRYMSVHGLCWERNRFVCS